MNIHKITAVFDELKLSDVEKALQHHGVKGFTLHPVKGRGNYFDSFKPERLIKHIQMEIYANAEKAEDIAALIVDTAHANTEGEGLVSIVPVIDLFWINTKSRATCSDFTFNQ